MSRGPQKSPIVCPTLELKDLADVLGFEKDDERGAVYGFKMDEDGYYVRYEIDEEQGDKNIIRPKLKGIRDVEIEEGAEGEYVWVYKNKVWNVKKRVDVDWGITFECISPYVCMAQKMFRKAANSGPIIASLVPETGSGKTILVTPLHKNNYPIHKKEGVTESTYVIFRPTIEIGPEATMIFDVILRGNSSQSNVEIMDGVRLSWADLEDEYTRIMVAIQKDRGEGNKVSVRKMASNENVKINIDSNMLKVLDKVKLDHIDFIGFYYVDSKLTPEQINLIVKIKMKN